MLGKKREAFLIVTCIFLILIVPNVLAIFEGLGTIGSTDLLDPIYTYLNSPFWRNLFHILIFTYLFALIIEKHLGGHLTGKTTPTPGTEHRSDKLSPLSKVLGLVMGVGFSLLLNEYNLTIISFGWLGGLVVVLFAIVTITKGGSEGGGKGKKYPLLPLLLGLTLLPLLLYNFFDGFRNFIESNEVLSKLFDYLPYLALIVFVIALWKWLFGDKGKGGAGGDTPTPGGFWNGVKSFFKPVGGALSWVGRKLKPKSAFLNKEEFGKYSSDKFKAKQAAENAARERREAERRRKEQKKQAEHEAELEEIRKKTGNQNHGAAPNTGPQQGQTIIKNNKNSKRPIAKVEIILSPEKDYYFNTEKVKITVLPKERVGFWRTLKNRASNHYVYLWHVGLNEYHDMRTLELDLSQHYNPNGKPVEVQITIEDTDTGDVVVTKQTINIVERSTNAKMRIGVQ